MQWASYKPSEVNCWASVIIVFFSRHSPRAPFRKCKTEKCDQILRTFIYSFSRESWIMTTRKCEMCILFCFFPLADLLPKSWNCTRTLLSIFLPLLNRWGAFYSLCMNMDFTQRIHLHIFTCTKSALALLNSYSKVACATFVPFGFETITGHSRG